LFSHHRSHGYYSTKNAPIKKFFAGSQDISYEKNKIFSDEILAGGISVAVGTSM